MGEQFGPDDVDRLAAEIHAAVEALPVRNTPQQRAIRREYTGKLKGASAGFVLTLAWELLRRDDYRDIAYELIRYHPAAFASLGETELEELGHGMDSWGAVDAVARTLAGPAWLHGQVDDALIERWARSPDRWWRRAALVSTVALNVRSGGGRGDTPRTLAICRLLVDDSDDMVVKALSWALRELAVRDPAAVRAFLEDYGDRLAARVRPVESKAR